MSPTLSRIRCVLSASTVIFLMSCASFYSAEPIEAWVVDYQSKKPLEGVIVVAQWKLVRNTFHSRIPVGATMVLETVTDAKGRFAFPSWGPIENPTDGHMEDEDPRIYLFKPGYFGAIANDYRIPYSDKPSRRKSDWHRQTIDLERFQGTTGEYASFISSWSMSIMFPYEYKDRCHFKKMPLLAEAFDKENTSLEARGYRNGGFVFAALLSSDRGTECGVTRRQSGGK